MTFWSMTDCVYDNGAIGYNGAKKFLSPSDMTAVLMS